MSETYTFELTFTGLCIFTFTGADKHKPERVDALLVDATKAHAPEQSHSHRHVPRLAFDARNVHKVEPAGYEIAPGPDGRLLGHKDMTNVSLQIEVEDLTLQGLEAAWRPDEGPLPETPDLGDRSEEDWLDWVMSLRRMNPETPIPVADTPFNGLRKKVSSGGSAKPTMTALVTMTGGSLKARGFLMRWLTLEKKWEYVVWKFKAPDDMGGVYGPHAMAGSVVLTIPGIPVASPVILKGDGNFKVSLEPKRELNNRFQPLVQASITNLPPADEGATQPDYLSHFVHFYEPVVDFGGDPPARLRLPERIGGPITLVGSFCPPTSHTDGT